MERLGQLHAEAEATGSWDLIVVDTPPARSALDFLDAPEHLSSLLDGRFLRILLAPTRGPFRLMSAGFSLVVVGAQQDPGQPGPHRPADVRRRVRGAVRRLPAARDGDLRRCCRRSTRRSSSSPPPEHDALREAAFFVDRLSEEKMPLSGLVINRVHAVRARRLRRARRGARRRPRPAGERRTSRTTCAGRDRSPPTACRTDANDRPRDACCSNASRPPAPACPARWCRRCRATSPTWRHFAA